MNQDPGRLDHRSVIPLYYQLKEILLEKIENGEWAEGEPVASESDLQRMYGVSRATVRRTMELLVNEGFLEKKRGKGTFVKKPAIEENLPVLKSFTEEMMGRDARKRVITAEYMKPSPKIKEILGLFPDEQVFYLKRLMIVDGSPLGILYSYLPGRYELSLEEDYSKSLYQILEKNGIRLSEADQIIEAAMSTKEEINLLGLNASFPTLVIRRIAYSVGGDPVEYVRGVYHAARYRYHLKLTRHQHI
ncbi:MAG: GntR family transcriptional regulator [Deltaproteobacteria bacterium]|nr:GntR family transcriptional regulator [Deltaproteobacteria bacterium]MBW2124031.1 GntR family transcriptional regulator [Deltaproteobacteria bacterium]